MRKKVQDADFSAKSEKSKLARLVLLDEFEKAIELLPGLVDSKKLTVDNLQDWPLFREFRKHEGVSTFMEFHAQQTKAVPRRNRSVARSVRKARCCALYQSFQIKISKDDRCSNGVHVFSRFFGTSGALRATHVVLFQCG